MPLHPKDAAKTPQGFWKIFAEGKTFATEGCIAREACGEPLPKATTDKRRRQTPKGFGCGVWRKNFCNRVLLLGNICGLACISWPF